MVLNKLFKQGSHMIDEDEPPVAFFTERHLMHNAQQPRAVTFYNFDPPKLLHYASRILETHSIQVVQDNRQGTLDWSLIPATNSSSDCIPASGTVPNLEEVLNRSRTFCMSGLDLKNELFRQRGYEQVLLFYAKGGTVVMLGGNCQEFNQKFNSQWSYRGNHTVKHHDCIPTPVAQQYLGLDQWGRANYPLQISIPHSMLIETPREEALYLPRPYTSKREYMEAYVDLEPEWYNDETGQVDEAAFYELHPNNHELWGRIKKRDQHWESHVAPTATPIAVHKSTEDGGGTLIWIGDAVDHDTNMRLLLSQLLTTDYYREEASRSIQVNRYEYPKGKYKLPI
jgi:hypothetical protein